MQQETVMEINSGRELRRAIRFPGVLALLLKDASHPLWMEELARAVQEERFQLDRSELNGDIDRLATWLERNLPRDGVAVQTRDALISDILRLMHLLEDLTSAGWYKLRIFTAVPNRRCGFHVDTVPPAAPVWGALRVYNGEGTDWVAPHQVRSMGMFYDWLQRRDRVVRRYYPAGDNAPLEALDDALDFLVDGARIHRVAAGTTVIFKHLDASEHWCDHPADQAWLHCSPMRGRPRLVVNISPYRRSDTL